MFDLVVADPEAPIKFDFIERFDFIEDTINSEFFGVYRMLDKIISNMCSGPSKPITYQAKLLETRAISRVVEAENYDEVDYLFAIIQSMEYAGSQFEVSFSIKTEEEIEIILKKGNTIIEQYEELQDAAQSDWLVIYCAAKKKLIDLIYKYYNEHKDTTELAAAWITRDLYKDWTDLKCQYWTQK
jgi:hypothetical protein